MRMYVCVCAGCVGVNIAPPQHAKYISRTCKQPRQRADGIELAGRETTYPPRCVRRVAGLILHHTTPEATKKTIYLFRYEPGSPKRETTRQRAPNQKNAHTTRQTDRLTRCDSRSRLFPAIAIAMSCGPCACSSLIHSFNVRKECILVMSYTTMAAPAPR